MKTWNNAVFLGLATLIGKPTFYLTFSLKKIILFIVTVVEYVPRIIYKNFFSFFGIVDFGRALKN